MDKCECCGTRHDPMESDCPDVDEIEFDGYFNHHEASERMQGRD